MIFRIFAALSLIRWLVAEDPPLIPAAAEVRCDPCGRPADGHIFRLHPSRGQCLHAGQPLAQWPPDEAGCPTATRFHSAEASLSPDGDGILFARRRLCFFGGRVKVGYSIECPNGEKRDSVFFVEHPRFTRSNAQRWPRPKRWLRRRNPKHSPIHFQQDRYFVELAEDAAVQSIVVRVRASHAANQPLYYSMSAPDDSRSAELFALDTLTGEIRVAKPLDRELLQRHVLKVAAYERLDPQTSSTTTVTVELLDVQDNAPQFDRQTYFAEIREDATVGTTVLSVFARDLDAGLNGEILYSLEADDPTFLQLFQIHPTSGVIQSAAPLDRETQAIVRLRAVATDKAAEPRSATALLEIAIKDVNDNSPRFLRGESCNISVAENQTIPAVVLNLRAEDADFGPNGEVHYSVVTSTNGALFSLDYDTADLTMHQRPDPRQSPYSLLIRAKDGGQPARSTTLHCTIHIDDVNDHSPTFVGTALHEIAVEENIPVGTELGRMFATDGDGGKNGEIRYRLAPMDESEGAEVGEFRIDEVSGVIRTNVELDREKRERYVLKVIASDLGEPPLSASVQLTIRLIDQNDNPPRFEPPKHELTLSEQTPRGHQLIELKATDADADSKLSYRLTHQDRPLFAVVPLAGGDRGAVLTLVAPFSPNDVELRVVVTATDQGGLSGDCEVRIRVVDENSSPTFVDAPVAVRVREDAPIGFTVFHVRAKDADREENAKLSFRMDAEDFAIDNATGVITVARPLDREQRATYPVTVTVSDNGDPPLSASTVLDIVIDDVNDNAPRFAGLPYRAQIREDSVVGTSFLQLHADDGDEGPNGVVDYFLNDTNLGADFFRLDRTSGSLRIHRPLDREKIERFELQVVARDRGIPASLESWTTVVVELEDVNDNAPQFEQSSYDLWIAENSPPGTVVGTLKATDPDIGPNAHIDFKIFGGPDARLFEVEVDREQNGVVRLRSRQEFDYESKSNNFILELQASSGQLSSTVPVRIHVSDVNDNQPQLADFTVLIADFVDSPIDAAVGSIPALDPDQNATLEYYLEPNELLDVERFSGALKLKGSWRRQLNAKAKACVSDGPNTVCAQCNIVYVAVDDEALRNSVTVELSDLSRDTFLEPATYERFLVAISALDVGWLPEDVRVFGVEAGESGAAPLNVSFFVSKEEITVSSWRVENAERSGHISADLEHVVRVVRDELCASEPCPYFQQCRRSLKRHSDSPTVSSRLHETDSFIFRSLATRRSFACECPDGFTTDPSKPGSCNQRLNPCYAHSCLNNGTCVPTESAYRCECPPDRTGTHCELSIHVDTCLPGACHSGSVCRLDGRRQLCAQCRWSPVDSDAQCRLQSVSLGGGGSFVAIRAPIGRVEFQIEVEFATTAADSVLWFAGASAPSDFVELALRNGVPEARISLGGESGEQKAALPDWRENRVADGKWHRLVVTYFDWTLRLQLDDCDAALSLRFASPLGYRRCAVEIPMSVSQRCRDDASLPCQRFLDVRPLLYLGANPTGSPRNATFIGCIRRLRVDQRPIDFSDFWRLERFGDVQPGCRRYRPDQCEEAAMGESKTEPLCPAGAKCLDVWEGHLCRCAHRTHSNRSCSLETSNPLTLLSEESFVSWRPPHRIAETSPTLRFEFRTRERKTQVLAVELGAPASAFIFGIVGGHGVMRMGAEVFPIRFPELADGVWHSVAVEFGAVSRVRVDHLYEMKLPNILADSNTDASTLRPLLLYSGNAPSTAYPSQFIGCLRNLHYGGVSLKVHEQSRTKPGCAAPNRCAASNGLSACPLNSQCHRDWDRHECRCSAGFVGDGCIDVCSIVGICANGGQCARTNSTPSGYECLCADGWQGENCERRAAPRQCPIGWWGRFEECRRCECRVDRGFGEQCDRENGRCKCVEGTFEENGRCVPCDCGYGAESPLCDPRSGQCLCGGDSTGRQCDRCSSNSIARRPPTLDRRSLRCVDSKDRCVAEMSAGIQWTAHVRGTVARVSCPYDQIGVAVRRCSPDGEWSPVDGRNCTVASLAALWRRVDDPAMADASLGELDVAAQLLNLTTHHHAALRPLSRNLDLALSVAIRATTPQRVAAAHLRDFAATRRSLAALDRLLDFSLTVEQLLVIVARLDELGAELVQQHAAHGFLRPFLFAGYAFDFAIDFLGANSLAAAAHSSRPSKRHLSIRTHSSNVTVFSAIVRTRPAVASAASIASMGDIVLLRYGGAANPGDRDAQIVFPVGASVAAGWRYPECVRARVAHAMAADFFADIAATIDDWRSDGATLVALNRTHATCHFRMGVAFADDSVLSIRTRPDSALLFHFALSHRLPYTAPLCAAFALFLCTMAVGATVVRRGIAHRSLRCAFILAFVAASAVLFALQRISLSPMFCASRNAALCYVLTAQFLFLFLLSLRIYRLVATGHHDGSNTALLLIGVTLPAIVATGALVAATDCSLHWTSSSLWLIAAPSALLLLLTAYASATAMLVASSGRVAPLIQKLRIRRSIGMLMGAAAMSAAHVGMALFALNGTAESPLVADAASNVALVFVAIYLFVWANFLSSECPNDGKSEFWLSDENSNGNQKPIGNMAINRLHTDSDFQSPLLTKQKSDDSSDATIPAGDYWPPLSDVIPADATYVHHTLQRSLLLQRPTPTPPIGAVLSPVPPMPRPLLEEFASPYASPSRPPLCSSPHSPSRYAAPRSPSRASQTPAAIRRKGSNVTAGGTMERNRTPRLVNNPVDEMNDAYYEFTGKRRRPAPCTTFS